MKVTYARSFALHTLTLATLFASPVPKDTGFGKLPLQFEENRGQAPARYSHISHGSGYVFLTSSSETVLRLHGAESASEVRMRLVDAKSGLPGIATQPLPGRVNYLRGNDPARWVTGVPTSERIRYAGVYPGIDAVYYGNQSKLEYDLVVAPGADPQRIELAFDGAKSVSVDGNGALVVAAGTGEIRWDKPEIYQGKGSARREVAGKYVMRGKRVKFELASYDPSEELVIDPVLVYSTLLGGLGTDRIRVIAVDGSGNTYLTGDTTSTEFPEMVSNFSSGYMGGTDMFIAKMNVAGDALLFSTYVGGNSVDSGYGLALDAANPPNVYVSGYTQSPNFPVVGGVQSTYTGAQDVVVVKLNPTGSAIVFSTFHGGSANEIGAGIAVNKTDGAVWVAGWTQSLDLPTASPLQASHGGDHDMFVLKLNAAGNARLFSTFLGGANNDFARGIALDAAGAAFVAGEGGAGLPNAGGIQAAYGGNTDCHLSKFAANGSSRLFSHYLGGNSFDRCSALAVDSAGAAYLTGTTYSGNFPLVNAINGTVSGDSDIFVAKLNAAGTGLAYSTLVGSRYDEQGLAIAVDSSGSAYVAGQVYGQLPVVNAIQPTHANAGTVILKSTDAGITFADSYSATGFTPRLIQTFAFQPGTPNTMLAGGAGGDGGVRLQRSTDAGVTWIGISGGTNGTVQSIAYAPSVPSTVFAATTVGLYKSTSQGDSNTWNSVLTGLPASDRNHQSVAVDHTDANIAYVALFNSGVYKTINGGANWTAINNGLTNLTARDVVIDPTNPQILLLATANGIFRSTDGGANWAPVNTGLSSTFAVDLAIAPSNHDVVYAAVASRVNRSTDGGLTWTPRIAGQRPCGANRIAVDPSNSNVAYLATSCGLLKTTDGGGLWSPVGAITANANVLTAAIHPTNNQVVFAGNNLIGDSFVLAINPAGSAISFLTHLGGRDYDAARAIAVDGAGGVYVAGETISNPFPVTSGVLEQYGRPLDAFVVKISPSTPGCAYFAFAPRSFYQTGSTPGFGYLSVTSPSGCAWTATSNAPWLVIVAGNAGTGTGVISYEVAQNPGPTRSGTITVGGQTVTITQAANGCTYGLTTPTIPAAGGAATATLNTQTGCAWAIETWTDWVTVTSPLSGTGPVTIDFNVLANPYGTQRQGTIRIAGIDRTLTQSGSCGYAISPGLNVFPDTAGTGSVNVTANSGCAWATSPPASFITITSGASGTGNGSINYSVAANPTGLRRTGSFLVAGSTTHSVVQNPAGCTFSLATSSANLASTGADGTVNVTAPGECARSVNSSAGWLTIIGNGAGSLGTSLVTFRAAANAGAARSATLDISGQLFTVNQPAAGTVTSPIPAPGVPNPSSGTGTSQTFTFTFEDAQGTADMSVLNVLINNAIDGRVACYLAYVVATNTLVLVNDAGDAGGPFVGALTLPGGTGSIGNSQCTINAAGSNVTTSGNILTMTLNITFTGSFGGRRIFYLAARDNGGNNSGWLARAVWQAPGGPATGGTAVANMTPARAASSNVTLVTAFTDTAGFADLDVLNLLINNAVDGRNACYVAFVRATGTLFLVNDAGQSGGPFAGGMTLPGAGSIGNSQCTINAAGSNVATGGNTLTLTLNITFSGPFAGDRIVHAAARDGAGNNSGWQAMGTITVP